MITIKLQGGLGNQMFQYAFAKALSLRNHVDFLLDLSDYTTYFRDFELEIFAIEKNYATTTHIPRYERLHSKNRYLSYLYLKTKQFVKTRNSNHHIEHNLIFDKQLLGINTGYIEGYFQSEKYFLDYADEIRKAFVFPQKLSPQNEAISKVIANCNAVSIHIRRGDYLSGNNISYHGVCSLAYYKEAIAYISAHIQSPVFFFFSDDMAWVKSEFNDEKYHYVDRNTGKDSYEDMRLMSLCKHNIVANSSFSWRGAWLNTNVEKIVIAPQQRFATKDLDYSNIVPEYWIKM